MTNVTPTPTTDLTGFEFAPRSIKSYGYGLDVEIRETAHKRGLHIEVEIQGLTLTKRQQRELARQLCIWKYGLRSIAPATSPIAQAFGIAHEYESL